MTEFHPAGAEGDDALDLPFASSGSGLRSRWTLFFTALWSVVGTKQMPTGAVDGSLTSIPLSAVMPRCVPITAGDDALTFLDLGTAELLGEPIQDVEQVAAATSADGCTATFLGAGGPATAVWQDGERLDLADVERVPAIAPDESAAIVASGEDVMLRSLTDLDDDGTELGALDANRYAFVED